MRIFSLIFLAALSACGPMRECMKTEETGVVKEVKEISREVCSKFDCRQIVSTQVAVIMSDKTIRICEIDSQTIGLLKKGDKINIPFAERVY